MTLGEILSSGLLQSIGIVGLLFTKSKATTPEAAPKPLAKPKVAEDLEQLRAEHQVRLIDGPHEGLGIDRAPAGAYGFTFAPGASSPVFANHAFQSFEVHKAADGTQYLLGFVSPGDASSVRSAGTTLDVTLYPEQYHDASELVCIPLDRVHVKSQLPKRDAGNGVGITVYRA